MVGRRIGSWILEKELSRGGMDAVFEARHVSLARRAAVKVLSPGLEAEDAFRQRVPTGGVASGVINRGSREGVSVGDQLIVGESEILRDLDTGEAVEELVHERARIKVVEVIERIAFWSLLSGKMGQIVERMVLKYSNENS